MLSTMRRLAIAAVLVVGCQVPTLPTDAAVLCTQCGSASRPLPNLPTPDTAVRVLIPLTDGATDTAYVGGADGVPNRPLLVVLHSWQSNSSRGWPALEREFLNLGYVVLRPNYRGGNNRPEACGSERAQQDILETIDWAHRTHGIDLSHVSLYGGSGGGHMALLMAGRYPERWRAVSAWVPITDMAAWRSEAEPTYQTQMDRCTGGDPEEYRKRSPITWLANARDVAIDINAGVNDPTIPYRHSVNAFNAIVSGQGSCGGCGTGSVVVDASPDTTLYGRSILQRRTSGTVRLTIFDGVHEGLVAPTIDWIKRHQ